MSSRLRYWIIGIVIMVVAYNYYAIFRLHSTPDETADFRGLSFRARGGPLVVVVGKVAVFRSILLLYRTTAKLTSPTTPCRCLLRRNCILVATLSARATEFICRIV